MNLDISKLQTNLLINNEWVKSSTGKTYPVINPSTGEKIVDVQLAEKEDVDKAVAAARKAFQTWGKSSPRERARLLNKLADLIEQNKEELAKLETLNTGKPLKSHTLAADIPQTLSCYRYYAGWADKIHGKVLPVEGDFFAFTENEPVGTVGQIIPWNWPVMMQAWKFGPALATGCTVVLKPSQYTPLSALYVGQLIVEAGFPPGVVNILPGLGADAGDMIVKHPGIDKVAFTGSTEVGKAMIRHSGETNLKRVSLELGGKGPHIIFADSDLDDAVQKAIQGLFFNLGQNCSAGSRVYVEEPIYNAFLEKITEHVKKLKVGDPFSDDTSLGPHTTEKQFEKTLHYIEVGKQEGAKLLTGGKRLGNKGFFVEPTIFADCNDKMKIVQDEIFGPVMCILKFTDTNDVIRRANDTRYGLTGGVCTNDINKGLSVAKRIRAGTVWVNTWNAFDTAVPFGGFKESGIGRELGPYGLRNYYEVKTISISMEKAKPILEAPLSG